MTIHNFNNKGFFSEVILPFEVICYDDLLSCKVAFESKLEVFV